MCAKYVTLHFYNCYIYAVLSSIALPDLAIHVKKIYKLFLIKI